MRNADFRPRRFRWIAIFIIPAVILLLAWVVMELWNSILPNVLHTGPISYPQALGILILSRLLFGGFRFFPGSWRRHHYPPFLRNKWMQMSDEERGKFREEWRKRCGRSD